MVVVVGVDVGELVAVDVGVVVVAVVVCDEVTVVVALVVGVLRSHTDSPLP